MSCHLVTSPTSGNGFLLFKLPSELRIMIWEYVFFDGEQYSYKKRILNSAPVQAFRQRNLMPYTEALETYFKQTTFHLNPYTLQQFRAEKNTNAIMQIRSILCDFREVNPNNNGFLKFLAEGNLPIFQARSLTNVTIRIWHVWFWANTERLKLEDFLRAALEIFQELKTIRLEIVISRGSQLASSDMTRVKHIVGRMSTLFGPRSRYRRERLPKGSELLQWVWKIQPKLTIEDNCHETILKHAGFLEGT